MEVLGQRLGSTGGQVVVDDVRGRAIGILAATSDRLRAWSSADLTVLMDAARDCRSSLVAVREAVGAAPVARP